MEASEFGRYRLFELIGQGGMGEVYKAHDTVMGRDVAIKILPGDRGRDAGFRERFSREALISARLTEPHIIPIHDTGEIDGRLYLVMPVISPVASMTAKVTRYWIFSTASEKRGGTKKISKSRTLRTDPSTAEPRPRVTASSNTVSRKSMTILARSR